MYVNRASQREWKPAGYAGGERVTLHLSRHEGRTAISRVKAGTIGLMHRHGAGEHAFIVSGKVEIAGEILSAGDYLYTEAGEEHRLVALEDSVIFSSTERPIELLEPQTTAQARA